MADPSVPSPEIRVKRVYAPPAAEDGARFLVDRLWPRGVRKADLAMTAWARDAAPSHALRRRYGHDPGGWDAFRAAYAQELDANPAGWAPLAEAAAKGPVTLLFAARDETRNNAVALKAYLESQLEGEGP
jgi:uncharacterized protein YeaO (DUF488 family)